MTGIPAHLVADQDTPSDWTCQGHHIRCPICEAETRAWETAVESHAQRLEAEGWRLVEAGQTGAFDDNNKSDWEVRDYRTGDVLAHGHDDIGAVDAVWREDWWDIGAVYSEVAEQ